MQEFFHELARILTIVLLSVAAFGVFVLSIAAIVNCTGSIIFGEKFIDWWDRKFPF